MAAIKTEKLTKKYKDIVAVFHANYSNILPHLWWVLGYTVAAATGAVLLFLRQMKRQ